MNKPSLNFKVHLFAAARDRAGCDVLELQASPGANIGTLRDKLLLAVPHMQPLAQSLLWAVNNEYADDDRMISESDSIACFPPVSGG